MPQRWLGFVWDAHPGDEVDIVSTKREHWPAGLPVQIDLAPAVDLPRRATVPYDRKLIAYPGRRSGFAADLEQLPLIPLAGGRRRPRA